ncbi:MAG: 30S ribosomal protein S17 [Nanoarchaeota archaeon]|nr:30S ribosomal protein S17 [Nanoarchaeota archaeon]
MEKKEKIEEKKKEIAAGAVCDDKQCPEHGTLSARGRIFEGTVVKKHLRRIAIELERTVYIKKYERYMKKKTRLHARVPMCKEQSVQIGDYVQIQECRPLSKIIHFVYIKTIRTKDKEKGK